MSESFVQWVHIAWFFFKILSIARNSIGSIYLKPEREFIAATPGFINNLSVTWFLFFPPSQVELPRIRCWGGAESVNHLLGISTCEGKGRGERKTKMQAVQNLGQHSGKLCIRHWPRSLSQDGPKWPGCMPDLAQSWIRASTNMEGRDRRWGSSL